MQTQRIARGGLEELFDGIFISERLGYDKPKKEYFDAAFASIEGFAPEEALIVGDSLSSDILGGKNAGITTVWYNPRGKIAADIVPDYEIHELGELISLLKKI